jgi:DNA-binding GntR family transcriptional regulator
MTNKPRNQAKAVSKTQMAYDNILNSILYGTYPPGTLLPEREISEQLKISRTPVKDALNRLAFEGYVEMYPDRGTVVSKVGLSDILELYEIRVVLEGLSAKLAAARRTDADLTELRKTLDSHKLLIKNGDTNNTVHEDNFHMCIAKASRNNRLLSQVQIIVRQCQRASIFHNQRSVERMQRSIEQHEKVYEVLAAGDAEEAEKAMCAHIQDVIVTTKELMMEYYFMY